MLFVGTSIIHPSTEGVFLLCNILDLLIYSYIYDKWDLIPKGSKNSPADMPNKIYNFLFKHRTVYDEKERKLYKDWLEKQNKN